MADPFPLPLSTAPMEALAQEALPAPPGWQYEPKWDGFRCLAFKSGETVDLRAKSGKPLTRYFPEVAERLRRLRAKAFVLDGELLIRTDARPSFDDLQLRLHPAQSRILKLSQATPATFVVFDLLAAPATKIWTGKPLSVRRAALEDFFSRNETPLLELSPATQDLALASKWLAGSGVATDGVVAKRLDDAYRSGERSMVKVKRLRTADCVVGGFRYASRGGEVGSLLLGLYDAQGLLNHVGFTSAIPARDRPALTRRLEKLRQRPGFTGRAPGGPSRWSTTRSTQWEPLKPSLVVEVRFDHVTEGRFRHGTTLLRWRPDKAPRQCTDEQLEV